LWGIRAQVDALDADDIVVSLLVAVLKWRVAGDVEVVLDNALVIAEDAEATRLAKTEGQGNDSGESHR
jgi:hypothetical protein